MSKFVEHPDWHEKNRRLAAETRVDFSTLADGTKGVFVHYSGMPIILTKDEALNIATRMADVIGRLP